MKRIVKRSPYVIALPALAAVTWLLIGSLTAALPLPWGGGGSEARAAVLEGGTFGPVGVLPAYPAAAGGTPVINFQGRLTNPATGLPVANGDYSVTFRIYDAATAGNNLWTETQATVAVSGGLFSVMLGSVTPLPTSLFSGAGSRFLETQVAADPPMTPRLQFGHVPYAFQADQAGLAEGLQAATGATLTDNGAGAFIANQSLQVQGALSVSGAIAMGYEQVVVPAAFHSGGFTETRTATCPAGKVVISGGVSIDNLVGARVVQSYPSSASSWTATASGSDSAFAPYAICARMAP